MKFQNTIKIQGKNSNGGQSKKRKSIVQSAWHITCKQNSFCVFCMLKNSKGFFCISRETIGYVNNYETQVSLKRFQVNLGYSLFNPPFEISVTRRLCRALRCLIVPFSVSIITVFQERQNTSVFRHGFQIFSVMKPGKV